MIALLVDSALRTAIVAGVVAAWLVALRVRNPYIVKPLWTAVLAVGLLMPLLIEGLAWRGLPAPIAATAPSGLSVAATAVWVDGVSRHVLEGVYALYAGVSLALLGRLALSIGRMCAVRRRAVRLDRGWLEPSCTDRLDVRLSARLASPVTFGSTILLPASCRGWPEAKRRSVLLHERSHVEQRDAYIRWLGLLHAAVFWFSPLAWWLSRHLTALAEQTSDEAVLRAGGDRLDYASLLLEFARVGARHRPVAAMAGGGVARRIERIVSGAPLHSRVSVRRRAVVVSLALPVAVLIASLWRPIVARSDAPLPSAALPGAAQPGAAQPGAAQPGASRAAQASADPAKIVAWVGLERYYPRRARRAGIEGVVKLAVRLDRAGLPAGVTVLSEQPAGHGFAAAASKAAQSAFRYRNPTGSPTTLVFDVKFALQR